MSDQITKVIELSQFLEGAKAQNVQALDVRTSCLWTDFFIVATYNSQGHLMGLLNELGAYLDEKKWGNTSGRAQKKQANEWVLIDLDDVVVHLFSATAREFYELEKLWYQAEKVYTSNS